MKAAKQSLARLPALYSANRTGREYAQKYYLPAAAGYESRAAEKGKLGAQIVTVQGTRKGLLQWRVKTSARRP